MLRDLDGHLPFSVYATFDRSSSTTQFPTMGEDTCNLRFCRCALDCLESAIIPVNSVNNLSPYKVEYCVNGLWKLSFIELIIHVTTTFSQN